MCIRSKPIQKNRSNFRKRNLIAKLYKYYLKRNSKIKLPNFTRKKFSNGWHLFQLNIDFNELKIEKEKFIKYLGAHSIGSQVHYIPLVLQPYYSIIVKKFLKGAMKFYNNTISIPMYTNLTKRRKVYFRSNQQLFLKYFI